jgi:proline dehydrogenase
MLRGTLLYLADQPRVREFVVANNLSRRVAHRFVAGERLDEALATARTLNQRGIAVSLDHLGENVRDAHEANAAAQDYIAILQRIKEAGLDATISIKLTALGLDVGEDLARENLRQVLACAAALDTFVRVDMEGSAYTERTIQMVLEMRHRFAGVGTVLQSCLYRTRQDLETLIAAGVRIRLVKGAYKEPEAVAFPNKADVDRSYVELMQVLLERGDYPAIATHDEQIIAEAKRFARAQGIARARFEFQMLYGIRRDLQDRLITEGYNVRVYVPYGSQWYPYLMRRMAERPANLLFVASNVVRR